MPWIGCRHDFFDYTLYQKCQSSLLFPQLLCGADVCACSTVLLHNALPFVGFGFLDNCIMIVAVSPSACCGVARLACSPATRHLLWEVAVGTCGRKKEMKSLFAAAILFFACF